MTAVSKLIKVNYTDRTSYPAEAGGDVLGVPFEHHWGPVGTLDVLDQENFFAAYPESMPVGFSAVSPSRYYAFAQIKKAFECGAKQVEAYRVQGNWVYYDVSFSGSEGTYTIGSHSKQFATIDNYAFVISLKYPGIPTKSMIDGYDRLVLVISTDADDQVITIKVCGATEVDEAPSGLYILDDNTYYEVDTDAPIESFEGGIDPSAYEDGSSYFIEKVCENSEFISVRVNSDYTIPATLSEAVYDVLADAEIPDEPDEDDWSEGITAFNDTLNSSSTLLISPLNTDTLDGDLLSLAEERQDVQAVIGYPVANTFSESSIEDFITGMSGTRNKFGVLVVGREKYEIFGYTIYLNCTGGWCGHTINIADTVRTNQLASAWSYGGYNGELSETLTFDDVHTIHELGAISVFSSNAGAMIFGVRSLHTKQTSYFGKANVMRVLTKILRQVFPICLDAIHTDAAANAITRASYDILFNRIITDEIGQQNLQSDSYAECDSSINSDTNTKGGTIFNLILSLHFIGLVEKFKINVIATDSSVTASV